MGIFRVTVRKRIEITVSVTAADREQAKALAWAHLPDHLEDWHCDIHNGTTFKVEEIEV